MSKDLQSCIGFVFRTADTFFFTHMRQVLEGVAPVMFVNAEDVIVQGGSLLRKNPPLISVWRSSSAEMDGTYRGDSTLVYNMPNVDTGLALEYRRVFFEFSYSVSCVSYFLREINNFHGILTGVGLNSSITSRIDLPESAERYRSLFPTKFKVELESISEAYSSEKTQGRLFEMVANLKVAMPLPLLVRDDGEFVNKIEMILGVLGVDFEVGTIPESK